jgi:hypothetical protein
MMPNQPESGTDVEMELARQLRQTQIDSHRVIAILLSKLGGSAHITDAELHEWQSTTITQSLDPQGVGFRLTLDRVTDA